jgi:PAS domain S-box-containing protein
LENILSKIKRLFTGKPAARKGQGIAIRGKMISAGLTILIGFGFAFSLLLIVNYRTDQTSQMSKEALRAIIGINHLNYKVKAVLSKKQNISKLHTEILSVIEECDIIIRRTTKQEAGLDAVLVRKLRNARNVWNDLEQDLQHSLIYLDDATKIDGHKEIALYGINFFLDSYDPSKRGALGNTYLFTKLRDFRNEITVIEYTANLFLRNLTYFSKSIDQTHIIYTKNSRLLSFAIMAIVTAFTIIFFIFFSGELTQKFRMIVKELAERNEILNERDEKLRAIMAAIPDLMIVLNSEGRYIDIFTGNSDLLIAPAEELLGKTIHEVMPADSSREIQNVINQALHTRESQYIEYNLEADDLNKWFGARGIAFRYKDSDCVLWSARDITERKQAESDRNKMEAQLQQAQKMEAIGTLAGGVAHDFNNILGIILGYSDMLKTDLSLDASSDEKLDQIIKAGNRAKDLVNQILSFSRQNKKEFIPIQPDLVIKEALKMLRSSIPTTIKIESSIPKSGSIIGDPTQLHQIVMNLCTNAYHAMRETGGLLKVLLEPIKLDESDTQILSLAVPPGPYLKLEISDNGHGMDKTTQQKIFDPYFTTKKIGEGTGLGLSVVHGIVKHFDGHISVYSEIGKGTVFRICLPQITTEAETTINRPNEENPTGDEHILVVDDEKPIVEMEKFMLEGLGYRVSTCTSSPEAFKVFQNQHDDICLVITDMTMPDMTGIELMQKIRAIRSDIPVILCSGFSELMNEEKAKHISNLKYLKKPVLKRNFALAVREILDNDKRFE